MTCTWCDKIAISAAVRPQGYGGTERLLACAAHDYLIDKLKYERKDMGEIRLAQRREALEAKR